MRAIALSLASLVLLAGCLGGGETPAAPETAPAPSAATGTEDVGVSGPQGAYRLEPASGDGSAAETVHPYSLPGGNPRPAAERVFTGTYDPADCTAFPAAWFGLGERWQAHDFSSLFEKGDVAEVHVSLAWENTDRDWADLHLWVDLPGAGRYFDSTQSAQDRGAIVREHATQTYWPGDEDDAAVAGVGCWYAGNTQPIEYTLTVHVSYAANAVPVATPVLLRVPAGATSLYVSGVPTGEAPVTSHFRVFSPDDALLGEFALNSDEAAERVPVAVAGDHVLIVDHTEGGFVSIGADAEPADPELVPLDWSFERVPVLSQPTPGPAAATVPLTIPRVPLGLWVWADAGESAPVGSGKNVVLDLEGPRGPVLHVQIDGFVALRGGALPFGFWIGLPGLDWQFEYDHHALTPGDHVLTLDAKELHGDVFLVWTTYVRPGEEGQGLPDVTPGSAPSLA